MKKAFLILVTILFTGILFAQTERTELTVQQLIASGVYMQPQIHTVASVVLTADDCKNVIHINYDADVIDFTLPGAEVGLVVAFGDFGGGAITVDPVDGTDKIWINGADGGAGNEMVSAGAAGNYIVLVAVDATSWWALPIDGDDWGIP